MRANKQVCCEVYGWTKHTFDQNVRDGMPVAERPAGRGGDYVVYTGDVHDWLVRRALERAGAPVAEAFDLNAERARLAREQADGQAMKNEVLRGKLLPAEEVVAGWQAAIGRSRALALGMPITVAPQLVLLARQHGEDAEALERAARDAMTRSLDAALLELSNTKVDDLEDDDGDEVALVQDAGVGAEV
jgi:phage terminase Nu1 subunit (DNA packaging protein)